MKIAHWNLGSAHLQNKLGEIEIAVKAVKPVILGISEANLHQSVDLLEVQLPGYTLYTARTLTNPRIACSRVVVYLGEGVTATVREDFRDRKVENFPDNSIYRAKTFRTGKKCVNQIFAIKMCVNYNFAPKRLFNSRVICLSICKPATKHSDSMF